MCKGIVVVVPVELQDGGRLEVEGGHRDVLVISIIGLTKEGVVEDLSVNKK